MPYVSGSRRVITVIAAGKFASGKIAPERKNMGSTMKFITIGKPCMSLITDPNAVPSEAKVTAIITMKMSACGKRSSCAGGNRQSGR